MSGVRINSPNIFDLVHHERRGNARSNSMSSTSDGRVRILSRYLRPSLSTCHDFCKFGEERTLEIKARGPLAMPKRNTATLAEGLDVERTSISVDRKKKLGLQYKSFPASKTQKLVFPILNGVVSPLTTEETVFSGQVSLHVKDIVLSGIRVEDQMMMPADDPKMKPAEDPKMKPLQPNKSSRRMERCSNNGQIKVETSKEMGNLSTDSPRGSSNQRRSRENESLVTGKSKALVPSSVSSSSKDSPKKVSSRNAQNSSNVAGLSHFSSKKTVRKSHPEQPSWEDVPEKTLHVVEANAEEKTPGQNVICVADLSPRSFSSHEDKSLEHAQKGSLTAQPSKRSSLRNLRCTLSVTTATNSPSSRPPSAKQNLRRTQGGIQAVNSPPSCPSSAKQKLRRSQHEIQSANSSPSHPPNAKHNLRHTRSGSQVANSAPFCPPSPRKKASISLKDENVLGKKLTFRRGKVVDLHPVDSTPTRLKLMRSVLGENQNGRAVSSMETPGKKEVITSQQPPSPAKQNSTCTENITRECDGPSTLKHEQSLGQKLTFRRGNLVELHPVDSTPTRLKFKKRVLGDSPNGQCDAGSKTVAKKEVIASRLSSSSAEKNLGHTPNGIQSSRLSWPPLLKKKGLRGTEFELGTTITRSYSSTSSLASLSMNGDETDTEIQILDLENEFKNMHEMGGTTSLKEECDPVQKLTFRRVKVFDIIHSEDSAPRMLKFKRRESLLGDSNQNESNDSGRISLGKQEIKDGTKTESKDVVLKHQDVEEKNLGNLLNNVIEETVSKLVKSRKSKVKALVGAFETLISLQDTKTAY